MSSFSCEHCGRPCIDTDRGYITGCEHYQTDIGPQRGPSSLAKIEAEVKAVRMRLAEIEDDRRQRVAKEGAGD